ncbi:hypothetical protein PPERSA_03772 [Pseudocohnilembus persalinus]|uniref:Uncharacterized protein n=1 Tax=Pseudocohnilembus persalinus TaxID=266149 RepID=A0A0V0QBH5_PSEPJ|nr:hypothetical protein PPERSA_03772 [Pseudocohnilembus persalinus]|eukprot:KRW99597.1 hypothetical protein PPERSA_03772 [Pseudocohnilembus persalinus]
MERQINNKIKRQLARRLLFGNCEKIMQKQIFLEKLKRKQFDLPIIQESIEKSQTELSQFNTMNSPKSTFFQKQQLSQNVNESQQTLSQFENSTISPNININQLQENFHLNSISSPYKVQQFNLTQYTNQQQNLAQDMEFHKKNQEEIKRYLNIQKSNNQQEIFTDNFFKEPEQLYGSKYNHLDRVQIIYNLLDYDEKQEEEEQINQQQGLQQLESDENKNDQQENLEENYIQRKFQENQQSLYENTQKESKYDRNQIVQLEDFFEEFNIFQFKSTIDNQLSENKSPEKLNNQIIDHNQNENENEKNSQSYKLSPNFKQKIIQNEKNDNQQFSQQKPINITEQIIKEQIREKYLMQQNNKINNQEQEYKNNNKQQPIFFHSPEKNKKRQKNFEKNKNNQTFKINDENTNLNSNRDIIQNLISPKYQTPILNDQLNKNQINQKNQQFKQNNTEQNVNKGQPLSQKKDNLQIKQIYFNNNLEESNINNGNNNQQFDKLEQGKEIQSQRSQNQNKYTNNNKFNDQHDDRDKNDNSGFIKLQHSQFEPKLPYNPSLKKQVEILVQGQEDKEQFIKELQEQLYQANKWLEHWKQKSQQVTEVYEKDISYSDKEGSLYHNSQSQSKCESQRSEQEQIQNNSFGNKEDYEQNDHNQRHQQQQSQPQKLQQYKNKMDQNNLNVQSSISNNQSDFNDENSNSELDSQNIAQIDELFQKTQFIGNFTNQNY